MIEIEVPILQCCSKKREKTKNLVKRRQWFNLQVKMRSVWQRDGTVNTSKCAQGMNEQLLKFSASKSKSFFSKFWKNPWGWNLHPLSPCTLEGLFPYFLIYLCWCLLFYLPFSLVPYSLIPIFQPVEYVPMGLVYVGAKKRSLIHGPGRRLFASMGTIFVVLRSSLPNGWSLPRTV